MVAVAHDTRISKTINVVRKGSTEQLLGVGNTYEISVKRSCQGGNPLRRRYGPPWTSSRSGSGRSATED